MADTPRTLAALQALFPDNSAGDISPQDLRDFLVSAGLQTEAMIAGHDISTATGELVNVIAGTSATPPTASTTTRGTLYVQYVA
jgi:hypothetical protein